MAVQDAADHRLRLAGQPSPADLLHRRFRLAHTGAEALNLLPSLYFAWRWLLMSKPRHCDEEPPWAGWDAYTMHGVSYATPCDIYSAVVLAAHPLHLAVNAITLGGAFGALTKRFWADDYVLKQYAVASGVGVLGSCVACVGCIRLYREMADYEAFIEAQPATSEWHTAPNVQKQSEMLLTFMSIFLLFFLWDFMLLGIRLAATALAARHEYFGKELRFSLSLLGGGDGVSRESSSGETAGGAGLRP
jgi:hypothetical protein